MLNNWIFMDICFLEHQINSAVEDFLIPAWCFREIEDLPVIKKVY